MHVGGEPATTFEIDEAGDDAKTLQAIYKAINETAKRCGITLRDERPTSPPASQPAG